MILLVRVGRAHGCRDGPRADLGGWFHLVGTERWEFIGSASPESDISANEEMGIASNLLTSGEGGASEFFVVERHGAPNDVEWPDGRLTRSFWQPSHVPLPDDTFLEDDAPIVRVSPSGRWIAVRGTQPDAMRDLALIYERGHAGWDLAERVAYPGYRAGRVHRADRA